MSFVGHDPEPTSSDLFLDHIFGAGKRRGLRFSNRNRGER
jgi:hypothetical protein